MAAIKTLKNNKPPGQDNLDALLCKAGPWISGYHSTATVWTEEEVSDDSTKGVICNIPKKGALTDCNNTAVEGSGKVGPVNRLIQPVGWS